MQFPILEATTRLPNTIAKPGGRSALVIIPSDSLTLRFRGTSAQNRLDNVLQSLTRREKRTLEAVLKREFDSDCVGFTLAGLKPMSLLQDIEPREERFFARAWKKCAPLIDPNRFTLQHIGGYSFFMNLPTLKTVFEKNAGLLEKLLGRPLKPEEGVQSLLNNQPLPSERLLVSSRLLGLFLGYGTLNSATFAVMNHESEHGRALPLNYGDIWSKNQPHRDLWAWEAMGTQNSLNHHYTRALIPKGKRDLKTMTQALLHHFTPWGSYLLPQSARPLYRKVKAELKDFNREVNQWGPISTERAIAMAKRIHQLAEALGTTAPLEDVLPEEAEQAREIIQRNAFRGIEELVPLPGYDKFSQESPKVRMPYFRACAEDAEVLDAMSQCRDLQPALANLIDHPDFLKTVLLWLSSPEEAQAHMKKLLATASKSDQPT